MLSDDQISSMLRMQQSMNSKVDPSWRQARFPYLMAVVIEGAEAFEHHGWKWWKKQELDLSQLQMELIDIWHFVLSEMLLRNDDGGDIQAREALQTAISDISATHELSLTEAPTDSLICLCLIRLSY